MESIKIEEDEVLIMDNSQVIKRRLRNLIYSDQYCGLCYEESNDLHSFDTELEIFGDFGFHEVTLYDVIEQIFKKDADKVVQEIQMQNMCSKCLEQLNKCYLFIGNIEYNNKIMHNYMDQLQSKVSEVEFIDNQEIIGIVLNHSENINNIDNSESSIQIDGKSSFRCSRCNIEIPTFEDLKLHERTHRWKVKVNCKVCNELVYKKAYHDHLRIKHSLFTNKILKPPTEISMKTFKRVQKNPPKLRMLDHRDLKPLFNLGVKSGFKLKALKKSRMPKHLKTLSKLAKLTHKDLKALPRATLKPLHKDNSIEILIPGSNENDEQKSCKLCFKDLDTSSFRTHKCQYSCTECDVYDCIHLKYLIEFREQMHNNMKLVCLETDCNYSCKSRKQMIGHLNRVHLDHHPFTCDMCKQQFFSKTTLKTHIQNYHSPNYYCDYCDQDFSQDPEFFNDHFESCKVMKREHPCTNCVAKFDSHQALERHHLRGCRNFACPHCKFKFTEEPKLSEHQSKVHNGIQRSGVKYLFTQNNKAFIEEVLTCEICGAKCGSKSKLRTHNNACHTEVLCPLCGKVCTKGSISSHIATHSHPDESLTCEDCGKQLKNMFSLKRHKLWHTEQVPCPVCSRLIHKGRLRKHVQYHNRKNRSIPSNYYYKIKCSNCDFRTSNKEYLEAHVNQIHLKIRPYICSVCSKGYCAQFELTKHMEAHTRPNEIVCNICDARLINKTSYRKHMSRHTGYCPYKCDSCERAFVSITLLKYHKAAEHSTTRNLYICPVNECGSSFKDQRRVRQHVKKVHWTNKDKPFDLRDVKGLDKKHYYLFDDCRRKPIK